MFKWNYCLNLIFRMVSDFHQFLHFHWKKTQKHFLCFQAKYKCWQCLLTNLLKILYSLNYVKQCHHNRIYRSTAIASAAIDWEQKIELLPAQVCHTLFTQQWDFFSKKPHIVYVLFSFWCFWAPIFGSSLNFNMKNGKYKELYLIIMTKSFRVKCKLLVYHFEIQIMHRHKEAHCSLE